MLSHSYCRTALDVYCIVFVLLYLRLELSISLDPSSFAEHQAVATRGSTQLTVPSQRDASPGNQRERCAVRTQDTCLTGGRLSHASHTAAFITRAQPPGQLAHHSRYSLRCRSTGQVPSQPRGTDPSSSPSQQLHGPVAPYYRLHAHFDCCMLQRRRDSLDYGDSICRIQLGPHCMAHHCRPIIVDSSFWLPTMTGRQG